MKKNNISAWVVDRCVKKINELSDRYVAERRAVEAVGGDINCRDLLRLRFASDRISGFLSAGLRGSGFSVYRRFTDGFGWCVWVEQKRNLADDWLLKRSRALKSA